MRLTAVIIAHSRMAFTERHQRYGDSSADRAKSRYAGTESEDNNNFNLYSLFSKLVDKWVKFP